MTSNNKCGGFHIEDEDVQDMIGVCNIALVFVRMRPEHQLYESVRQDLIGYLERVKSPKRCRKDDGQGIKELEVMEKENKELVCECEKLKEDGKKVAKKIHGVFEENSQLKVTLVAAGQKIENLEQRLAEKERDISELQAKLSVLGK